MTRDAGCDTTTRVEDYSHLSATGQRLVRRFRDRVVALVESHDPACVLEVGCGQGWLLADIRDRLDGIALTGVDIRPDAIEFARSLVPEAHLFVADAHQLEFEDDTFDVVVCSEVLEHVERPSEVLAELIRVSKGPVIVSVPHEPWFWLANLLRGKYLSTAGNCPGHIHHWTGVGLRRLLSHDGATATVSASFPWLIGAFTPRAHDSARMR